MQLLVKYFRLRQNVVPWLPFYAAVPILIGAAGYAGGKKGQAEELAGLQKQFNDLQAKAKSLGITIADALHPNSAVWLRSQIDDITKASSLDKKASIVKDQFVPALEDELDDLLVVLVGRGLADVVTERAGAVDREV